VYLAQRAGDIRDKLLADVVDLDGDRDLLAADVAAVRHGHDQRQRARAAAAAAEELLLRHLHRILPSKTRSQRRFSGEKST
jgi:hypothetical protein